MENCSNQPYTLPPQPWSQQSKRLRRLIWITGCNGWGIAGGTAVVLLLSLAADPGLVSLLAGLAVTLFALLEIRGWQLLKRADIEGLSWAGKSQIGVFLTIAAYSLFQLATLTPETICALLSPELQALVIDFYRIDDQILGELLLLSAKLTYLTLIAASAIYQGGLWLYYHRSLLNLKSMPEKS